MPISIYTSYISIHTSIPRLDGISPNDRRTNEELRSLVGVEPITTFIRSGRLRWYGHVMRKGDEDWVKKCMEYRVEGRRPVGRPRKTWLESVEADMAELEQTNSRQNIFKVALCTNYEMPI